MSQSQQPRNKLPHAIAVPARTFSKHPVLREKLLEKFSNVKFNDTGVTLTGKDLTRFMQGSVAAIVALEKITDDELKELPELKVISKYGVGLDNLDLEALKRRGIQLGWTPGVNARSVSELALVMIMASLRNVFTDIQTVAQGKWESPRGHELTNKTVGIIGFGNIGRDLSRLLVPFRCRVLVHDILDLKEVCKSFGAEQIEKDFLLRDADAISLHVPYDSSTRHLISSKELQLMKSSAVLVNTSRGNVVDECALYEHLKARKIRAAAMDVFEAEPPVDCPLLSLPNFAATPHVGGSSIEGIMSMGTSAINNLYEKLVRQI